MRLRHTYHCFQASAGSTLPPNGRDLKRLVNANGLTTRRKYLKNTGRMCRDGGTSAR